MPELEYYLAKWRQEAKNAIDGIKEYYKWRREDIDMPNPWFGIDRRKYTPHGTGRSILPSKISGTSNTFIGEQVMNSPPVYGNQCFGYHAFKSDTTPDSYNVTVGVNSLSNPDIEYACIGYAPMGPKPIGNPIHIYDRVEPGR